jgi:hypothetical protein
MYRCVSLLVPKGKNLLVEFNINWEKSKLGKWENRINRKQIIYFRNRLSQAKRATAIEIHQS